MNFFLPLATSSDQAERVYKRIVDRLKRSGFALSEERIYKIIYREGSQLKSETVGAASTSGDIVLAIFQNDIGYFVCTYSTGAVWGEPTVIQFQVVDSAEKFDAD
jgi:hypothetical protein